MISGRLYVVLRGLKMYVNSGDKGEVGFDGLSRGYGFL